MWGEYGQLRVNDTLAWLGTTGCVVCVCGSVSVRVAEIDASFFQGNIVGVESNI